MNEDQVKQELHEALGTSQRLGFLGDRPIDEVIEHARAFVSALEGVTGSVIDLGAGGGVPGLVLAVDRPDLSITLLDRRTKRTDFLSRIVRRMHLDHVTVVAADVDDAIRQGYVGFDAVVARGFGPPDFTLRTGARCLGQSGVIVISEPPTGDRWDAELVSSLGLVRVPSDTRVVCFTREFML
ncbi:RsmG family class I SAM-dependent methyltransferase [Ilumatobacter sp.]|uniref:RsmG family class I SAM-dependent methyltransferase n=1 Tax=Ilumatobacter sp. TaxID=1967498 RepID=UPI003751AD7E